VGLLQLLLRSRRAQPLPAGRAPDGTAAAYSVTVSNVSVSGVGNDTVSSVGIGNFAVTVNSARFGNVTVSRVSVGNLAAAAVSSGNAVAVAVGNANGRVYLGRVGIAVPVGRR
jgi:hypothetical protein